MLKLIISGFGTGKSTLLTKKIIQNNRECFCNFYVRHELATSLQTSHIVKKTMDGKKEKLNVNWAFWKDLLNSGKRFDIYIDEAHNVANARRALSKWNVLFTRWLTQIRKIVGDSEDYHLYMVAQRLASIDPVARELATEVITCVKIIDNTHFSKTEVYVHDKKIFKDLEDVYIIKYVFMGKYAVAKYEAFEASGQKEKSYDYRSYFYANPFFKYFDSYSLVTFGDESYI